MKIISDKAVRSLDISTADCIAWVRESFSLKENAQLPPKPSVHPEGIDFFTTMPCLLPAEQGRERRFGVKVVHRLRNATPSLGSDIMLYSADTGELLAIIDGDWITAMRTGAVATLAMQTLRKSDAYSYGIMGLGNTARATLLCLLTSEPEVMHHVRLLRYKDQAGLFAERFKDFANVEFCVDDTPGRMISQSDVVLSCVTQAVGCLCDDNDAFRPGCLVVPVHTRGFQNCDLFFDKVFADDTAHVRGFKYFDRFRQFAELQDVLDGTAKGRESDDERILSYNIGLGLHDVLYASKIYDMAAGGCVDIEWNKETAKFWV